MLKMYQRQPASGGSAEFWDGEWAAGDVAATLADARVVENDPTFELVREKARRDGLFLEGGCGQAQWVKYLSARGYRTLGVDFAPRTVARVRELEPSLDVRVGDILDLPIGDAEVHTYFSNGVVEHREAGPTPALREARRVIARDGWFLCGVPDDSSLRRLIFRGAATERRDLEPPLVVRHVDETVEEAPPPGLEFFQYAFREPEFTRLLEQAGFIVERSFGYGLVWGLAELPRFRALYEGSVAAARALRERLRGQGQGVATDEAAAPSRLHDGAGGWLRRALVKEDRTTPLFGPLVDIACEHCSNMRMYVARPA